MPDAKFKLIVDGKIEAVGAFRRAVSPRTVSAIQLSGKLSGRAIIRGCMAGFVTSIVVAPEKPRTQFKRGDLCFDPADRSIWIVLGDCRSVRPMNLVGVVESNLDALSKIRRGSLLVIEPLD